MKKAIYMRRSNDVQSDDRQRFICNPEWEIYSDQISAFRTSFFDLKRVEAKRLRDDIEAGKIDYVIITECSRLERRVDHYMKTIQWFRERKIQLKVLDLNVELFSEIDGEWQSDLNSAIVAFMSFYVAQRESMEKSFRTKLG
jgi:DNA invertase Pin-like site-specific DNA recombinase